MKKTLILVLIAVFVMIPLASFAKTAISDSELSTVTGEAGISISIDVSSISWGVATIGPRIHHHLPKIITFMKPSSNGGSSSTSGGLILTAH